MLIPEALALHLFIPPDLTVQCPGATKCLHHCTSVSRINTREAASATATTRCHLLTEFPEDRIQMPGRLLVQTSRGLADGPDDGTLHEQAARECKERERCVSAAGGKAVAEKQSTERVSQLLLPRRARALWSRRRKVIVCSEK